MRTSQNRIKRRETQKVFRRCVKTVEQKDSFVIRYYIRKQQKFFNFFVTKPRLLRLTCENFRKEAMITDAETSRKLYEAYYMSVYSYVMTIAGDHDLAEEITQETFYRAITARRSFQGGSDVFTWLCAIAKNLFYDEMRRHARRTDAMIPEEIPDADSGPGELAADKDDSFRIHMVLHSLEEPYKEVFELRCFGELSFRQIGTIFGKTENWARVTYHRARLKIQERMENT